MNIINQKRNTSKKYYRQITTTTLCLALINLSVYFAHTRKKIDKLFSLQHI